MRIQAAYAMLSDPIQEAIRKEQDHLLRQSFMPDLEARIGSSAFMAALWDRLSDRERQVVRLFLEQAVQGFFTKREWDRLTREGSAAWLAALTRLRRLGLVMTVRKMWSEIGYLMPIEVRQGLYEASSPAKSIINESKEPLTKSLSYYIPSGRGIHLELFALLAFIREEEVPLTKKRTIHGRYVPRMAGLLSLGDKHVGPLAQRIWQTTRQNAPLPYPAALALVLDLSHRMELVRQEEGRLVVDAAWEEWLGLPLAWQLDQLWRLVVDHYLPPVPWMEAGLFEMMRSARQRWHALDETLQALRDRGYHLPEDAVSEWTSAWLHPLLGLGLIELGADQSGGLFWKWRDFPSERDGGGWYLQPTGEVLLPTPLPLTVLWQLARFAQLTFEGEMMHGTLDSNRVQHELSSGTTEQGILDFLEKHCLHPLPEGISSMIHSWARQAKQIRLERVICVRTADPRVLEELKSLPSLAALVAETISETSFLIPVNKEKELVRLLKEYGYQPLPGQAITAREPREPVEQTKQDQGRGVGFRDGLFDISPSWQEYHVENLFPEYADSVPQLALLPRMWTRHYQSYHQQTLRDLLKRSHELALTVRLDTTEGEWEGTVQKMGIENGYWCVTLASGKKILRCTLEEVRRARILLPDYF